jgi:hypothetical protein
MLKCREDPAAWAAFVDQLGDGAEHLTDLVKEILNNPEYSEEELRVGLGHVFAHLNRAWNTRHIARELTHDEWEELRRFPNDLEPIA